MTDDERVVRALHSALREAADQVEVRVPAHEELTERTATRRRRPSRGLVAVAAMVVVAGTLVAALVLTRHTAEPTVTTDGLPRRVDPSELARDEADLLVVMAPEATEDQVAAVRTVIASSPDVVLYAEVAGEEAIRDLMASVCPGEDSLQDDVTTTVSSVPDGEPDSGVAADGPSSFRIAVDDSDEGALARLRDTLAGRPGVMVIDEPSSHPSGGVEHDGTECDNEVVIICSEPVEGSPPPDPRCPSGPTDTPRTYPPAEEIPATTTPSLPSPSGVEPADPEAARAAIVEAYTTASDGSLTASERRAHVEDSDELGPYMGQAAEQNPEIAAHQKVTLGDIVFIDAERAAVAYTLTFDGFTAPITSVGYAVLDDDGHWKVSRETVCSVIAHAGVICPPDA